MTHPDLSFLLRNQEAAQAPAPATPPQERRAPDRVKGPVADLIAQLRTAQRELQAHNEVLRYSQQAAESASERFEALFAGVPLALMVLDEHDMVVQANAVAHRAFQPGEGDRPLAALMPFVSAGDAERVRQAFAAARRDGRSDSAEVVFEIGSGQHITGDLHIAYLETPQAQGPLLQQFLCAVVDQGPLIAERRALQQRNDQLHSSEQRLEAIINSALDAIISVDAQRRITVFNPAAATLFQCPAGQALGEELTRFLPDAEQALSFAQLTTRALLGEMQASTATGQPLAVEVSVAFESLAGDNTTTFFIRDLTSQKKADLRRGELEAQLRESHKMQAVGTMAGGIAHDFNNILHAILGNVALAHADAAALPAGSALLESLAEIEKAGRRARDLVHQILTFSRNEPLARSAVQVAATVHDTARLLRVTLPPNIELQLHLPATLPPVLADATQLEQALLNLCTNAVHAIGQQRGHIAVQARALRPDAALRERLRLAPGSYVALSVSDDGPGMDDALLARIYEPFFTTKPVGQGTGLGLAVVHGVVRSHGGAVDVHSQPGEGTRFTLYFPVASDDVDDDAGAAPAPQPASAAPPATSAAPAGGHVVYVDDDQALVFLVQRLLRRQGHRVSGFTDPHQALAFLREQPQAVDLLVTDYNMPGFSGVDLLQAVRAIRADLPVALASGYVTADIEQAARAAGARALIHKPNDVQELCATVDRLLHAG
ncbi:hypothetical protein GCM10022279_14570 [Comamonas faecalis]|uniref:histidine kinase n=1 Tax=Comamonas faecalis TaxID=1387849 RepID=A0ABP7R590_9BURK